MYGKVYDNKTLLLNTISTLNSNRKVPALNVIISTVLNNNEISNIDKKENKDLVNVIVEMNKAIIQSNDPDKINMYDIIDLVSHRDNINTIDLAKNALDDTSSTVQLDNVMKIYNSAAYANTFADRRDEILNALTEPVSMLDLPEKTEKLAGVFTDIVNKLKKEKKSIAKKKLVITPDVVEGVREIQLDILNESKFTLRTGNKALDEVVFPNGITTTSGVILISSWGGGGKSAFMISILMSIILHEENYSIADLPEMQGYTPVVMMVSYENTMLQTFRRIMSLLGMRKDYLDSLTYEQLHSLIMGIFGKRKIGLVVLTDDARTQTASELAAYIKEEEEVNKRKVILLGHDYVNLAKSEAQTTSNEYSDVGNMAQEMREEIFKKLGIPVISACQLKTEAEGKVNENRDRGDNLPIRTLSGQSIYGGNILKQKCDVLIFVAYALINNKQYVELVVDKDRNGREDGKDTTSKSMLKDDDITIGDFFRSQDSFYSELIQHKPNLSDFYGKDGRIGVAILRRGLVLEDTYYADRFKVSPESAAVANMFNKVELTDDIEE